MPTYLQSTVSTELCDDWAEAINQAEAAAARSKRRGSPEGRTGKLWRRIRGEVAREIDSEPVLSSFLFTSVLTHSTLAEALSFILSNRIADQTMLPTQLFALFASLLAGQPHLLDCAVADLEAVHDRVRLLLPHHQRPRIVALLLLATLPDQRAGVAAGNLPRTCPATACHTLRQVHRSVSHHPFVCPKQGPATTRRCVQDPSCKSYSQALLYYKGYHAMQLHRFANELWRQDRKAMALSLQSRVSEVLAVDIHPAATIRKGILMDHGTGVVIGETAVIGDGASIMQVYLHLMSICWHTFCLHRSISDMPCVEAGCGWGACIQCRTCFL